MTFSGVRFGGGERGRRGGGGLLLLLGTGVVFCGVLID